MSIIAKISTSVPNYKYSQDELADFMSTLFDYSDRKRNVLKEVYRKSGIANRYSVIPDYGCSVNDRIFYPRTNNLEPFPDVAFRMLFYAKHALPLAVSAIEKLVVDGLNLNDLTHLIVVSCTGLSAPGLEIDLIRELKLNSSIERTSINFIGCYAAVHGLKQANAICNSNKNAVVLVVSLELCSIHFQKIEDADNITSNLLFGDGAAAIIVTSDNHAKENKLDGFRIDSFYSDLLFEGSKDMAWQVSASGFLMTLSSYIPKLIEVGIKDLLLKALEKNNLKLSEIDHWAIHPGGRRILEVIHDELELSESDLSSSYKVLNDYGNMSSPTILFVLKDILESKIERNSQQKVFGVAFGPGLTMESFILTYVQN